MAEMMAERWVVTMEYMTVSWSVEKMAIHLVQPMVGWKVL